MEKKHLLYFSLILIGAVILLWRFKKRIGFVIPVHNGDDSIIAEQPVSTDDFSGSVNSSAPATQTYNAPTRIMASDPASQSYLSNSQATLAQLPNVLVMANNAASTGLTE
jgi:hypothetical protein